MGVDFIVIHRMVNGVRETIIYCGPVVEGSGGLGQRGAGGKDLGHRLPPVEFPQSVKQAMPQTATIRSLVCSCEMRPLPFLDPSAFIRTNSSTLDLPNPLRASAHRPVSNAHLRHEVPSDRGEASRRAEDRGHMGICPRSPSR